MFPVVGKWQPPVRCLVAPFSASSPTTSTNINSIENIHSIGTLINNLEIHSSLPPLNLNRPTDRLTKSPLAFWNSCPSEHHTAPDGNHLSINDTTQPSSFAHSPSCRLLRTALPGLQAHLVPRLILHHLPQTPIALLLLFPLPRLNPQVQLPAMAADSHSLSTFQDQKYQPVHQLLRVLVLVVMRLPVNLRARMASPNLNLLH